jgi:hypothetical protein
LGGTTTATTNASGVATFTNLSISGSAGSRTLSFTSDALTGVTSAAINVSAGAATTNKLVMMTDLPPSATSGTVFKWQPQIQIQDAANKAVAQAGVVVTATLASGEGTLGGTPTATTNAAGVATFANLSISGTTSGNRTLSFTANALGSVTAAIGIIASGPPTQLDAGPGPVLTAVSGTASPGATLTISGSGFGTKASAKPFYFGDYESATVGQTALQAGLDDAGTDGHGVPIVRTDRAFSGKQSLRMDYGLNQGANGNMFPRIGKSGLNTTEVYVSVWTYWVRTAGPGTPSPIFKFVRGGAIPFYSGIPQFHETIRPLASGIIGGTDRGTVNSDGTGIADNRLSAGQDAGGWHRSEYYFKLSDAGVANGVFQSWVDGKLNANVLNTMSRLAGNTALINYIMSPADGMDSYGLDNAYQLWIDDFYIDTTRARVEVGDAPTLEACKTRTVLPTSQWAEASIAVTANLSMFATGSTVYLYVFNSNGNANSQGYPVTVR